MCSACVAADPSPVVEQGPDFGIVDQPVTKRKSKANKENDPRGDALAAANLCLDRV